jgi:hypothetical protein
MFNLKTKNITEPVTLKNLPTIRQALTIAGLIILVSFILAEFVHPNFIYLALVPALGLLFSGTTGVCPLVLILQLLPFNSVSKNSLDKTQQN